MARHSGASFLEPANSFLPVDIRMAEEGGANDHQVRQLRDLMRDLTTDLHKARRGAQADIAVRDACLRLNALTCLHRQLTRMDSSSRIQLSEFFRPIRHDVASSLNTVIDLRACGVTVSAGIANRIGVLVTEFAINAARHGAHPGRAPILSVDAAYCGPDRLGLTLQDDGRGLPADFEIGRSNGFGMRMVRSLVDRQCGTVHVVSREHAEFRIILPVN